MIIFYLLIIIFSFLQATILSLDIVTVLVLWVLLVWTTKRAWINVWIAGLLVELISGEPLGWISLLYLTIGLGLWIYRKKYFPFHPVFLFLFTFGSISIIGWFTNQQFMWKLALISGTLFVLLRHRMTEIQIQSGKLKVEN